MTWLNIAVCENSQKDRQRLEYLIKESEIPSYIDFYANGENLLYSFAPDRYNLVFLDIYLNGISGIKTAEEIRRKDKYVVIVFATTNIDHVLESYRLGAFKYLEKPVAAEDVLETLEYAKIKHKLRKNISLPANRRFVDIPLETILYFTVNNHNVRVHTISSILKLSQKVKLNSIEARLPSPPFLRCHHSYLVNLDYVESLDRDFQMKNGDSVYIRTTDLGKCAAALKKYQMERDRCFDRNGDPIASSILSTSF